MAFNLSALRTGGLGSNPDGSAGLGVWREERAVTRSPGAASPDHFSEGTARAQTAPCCWVLVTACVTLGYSLTSLCPQFPYPCLWPVMVLSSLGSYEHLMNSHL